MFNNKLKGIALASTATLLWAASYIVNRFLFGEEGDRIDPLFFNFMSNSMAGVFFTVILSFNGKIKAVKHALVNDWQMFLVLALLGVVFQGTLCFYALKFTTASRAGLFANTAPIFTVILAFFVLNEKISKKKLAGMFIGFAGILTTILSKSGGDTYASEASIIGDGMALLSGIFWAAYTVWGENVKKYGGTVSAVLSIILGAGIMFLIVLASGKNISFVLSIRQWLGVLYLGIFSQGLAFVCWFSALKYIKAGELGAFGFVSAVLIPLMSIILLKEDLSLVFLISMLTTFIGVFLMISKQEYSEKSALIENNELQSRGTP